MKGSIKTISEWTIGVFIMTILFSCAKPNDGQLFAPAEFPTCSDGVLNQGEYFIDCGGPCDPCGINTIVTSKVVDSTWTYPNNTDLGFSSNYEGVSVSGNNVTLYAADTIAGIYLTFSFDKTWRGVHYIDSFPASEQFSGFGFSSRLESGVVEVTNIDTINNFITGKFSFNCAPEQSTGVRLSLYEGEFRDIPTTNN